MKMVPSCPISVVIPTYRRCKSLQRLLLALSHQTVPPEQYEVVVSIDGSEDGTREMAAEFLAPYRLRVLWQPNAGRASACNAGIRAAAGDLLIILDDDMEPVPDFLAGHLRAHSSGSELCVVGAVPVRLDQSSSPVLQFVGSKHNQHGKRLSQPGHRFWAREFYSGNCSVPRESLLRVGAFDEEFKVYGNEDCELFIRLNNAGIPVIYSAEALAYQHYEKDFATLARDKMAQGRTAVQLTRKHPAASDAFMIARYRQTSVKWRCVRAVLLSISRAWSGVPRFILSSVSALVRLWPSSFRILGPATLDYLYWESAFSAMREHRGAHLRTSKSPPCL